MASNPQVAVTDVEQSSLEGGHAFRACSKFSCYPFDIDAVNQLPFDVSDMSYVELTDGSKHYHMVVEYIGEHSTKSDDGLVLPAVSFGEPKLEQADEDPDDEEYVEQPEVLSKNNKGFSMQAGLGLFAIRSLDEQTLLYALHQTIGEPLGTNCGVVVPKNLVLFTKGHDKADHIGKFLKELTELNEKTAGMYYTCFKWHSRHEYWRRSNVCRARNIDSVVLPTITIDKITKDIDRFLDPKTKKFYDYHGIPYRRSFLFYGVPGAGKTSLIQALAGHYKRNICFLQLTDKLMSDDSLLASVASLPKNTIVVMEDVDSCFAGRANKIAHSKITFSGLLNALDGVGSSFGQIFILTTNLKDQLDPALIRCGRVDLKVEFSNAIDEQCVKMWKSFYPDSSEELATNFVSSLRSKLAGREINTASLQHFFVVNMHSTADESLASLSEIIDDMDFMNAKIMAEEGEMKEKEKEKKEGDEINDEEGDEIDSEEEE